MLKFNPKKKFDNNKKKPPRKLKIDSQSENEEMFWIRVDGPTELLERLLDQVREHGSYKSCSWDCNPKGNWVAIYFNHKKYDTRSIKNQLQKLVKRINGPF